MAYGVVASIGVDSRGHTFVYNRTPTPILEFDPKEAFVKSHRDGTDVRGHSLRIDVDDNMWLVDSGAHTVVKVSPKGDVLLTLGTKGVSGAGDVDAAKPLFNIPSDIAIAPNGDIFVAQGEAGGPDPRVIHFDRNGRFINTWSLRYTEGTRSNPHAIEVDKNGLIYVADREVMRIRVFRPDGTSVRDMQMQNLVCGLFIDRNQQLWVSSGTDGMVLRVDWDGRVLGKMGTGGRGAGQIGEGHMLTVTPAGDVFVADSVNRVVHKFAKR
jgi:peptidylamidoglycolate lyase